MKWFKRMVARWVEQAREEAMYSNDIQKASRGLAINTATRDVGSDPTLQFKIYNAIGGKVVEFSRYDRKSDRHNHDIYIISKEDNFGEKIAKIAMLETLKD